MDAEPAAEQPPIPSPPSTASQTPPSPAGIDPDVFSSILEQLQMFREGQEKTDGVCAGNGMASIIGRVL